MYPVCPTRAMDYGHGRFPRAGHGRRVSSTNAMGPLIRARLGQHLTVLSRLEQSGDIHSAYSYPFTGHSRRATSTNAMGPLGLCAVRTPWTGTGSQAAH
ncbi:hypothetical protein DPMN_129822 [Dreissena polymorpha]|uniref:Uncharacterized protein n=1 Tax=Dreissena polymorpha TaxID=45954 RepID=A0A9D4H5M0_DREPO|nr:hypothetical protein DPMN_129822 [Dreissena polymorpha]